MGENNGAGTRTPGKVTKYSVYANGGPNMLGSSEVTLPSFEALAETMQGAGLAGEVELPSAGHFSAMTLTMPFRILYGDVADFAVGKTYRFDLRAQIEYVDTTTFDIRTTPECWQIVGPIKKVDPGKRVNDGFADATIEVSVFHAKHYLGGAEKLEFNAFDPDGYKINGESVTAAMED